MGKIVCRDCKKRYDFDVDEFCPRCGSFNQPAKTWDVDAQGNLIRVDGLNERNHKGSFVHKEYHTEKATRRVAGMDRTTPAKKPQVPKLMKKKAARYDMKKNVVKIIAAVAAVVALILEFLG